MAAVQKGLDQLDRGEGIPHDEVKRQLASCLQINLVSRCARRPSRYVVFIARDNPNRPGEVFNGS
jgi:hypothetical protein